MKLAFTKMNGLGNDFMVVPWPSTHVPPAPEVVRRWADRRRGVGFDQLLLVDSEHPSAGDASYRVFNADGGEVEQCGNGVRCLARYLAPRLGNELKLVSPAGTIAARVESRGPRQRRSRRARLSPRRAAVRGARASVTATGSRSRARPSSSAPSRWATRTP